MRFSANLGFLWRELPFLERIELGARAVHVLAGTTQAGGGLTDPDQQRCYRENIQFAAAQASELQLQIWIEPISRRAMPDYALHDIVTARGIVDSIGHPDVCLIFDCFHVQAESGALLRHFEEQLSCIGHVQIAGGHTRAEPDRGEINYDYVLPAMRALGYTGAFGCEYTPEDTVEKGLRWRSGLDQRFPAFE